MSILTKQGEIQDPYRSFISKSRYSKWIESENRRETWTETVDRYIAGMKKKIDEEHNGAVSERSWNKMRTAILNHKVMPSMRGLMTAGSALERNELAIFNCFTGGTKVMTKEYGSVSLAELAGEKVTAWTPEGWRGAEARYFGEQPTQRVIFKPYDTRSNHRIEVDVTPDHRWILSDGFETTELKVGDRVATNVARPEQTPDYDEGVRHGIIFGDGAHNVYIESTNKHHHHVAIFGQHAEEMLSYFEKYTYNPSRKGAPTAYHSSMMNLKEFPIGQSAEYNAGFIYGWLLADGNQIRSESPKLDSQKPGAYEWLAENAASAGYAVVGVHFNNKPTNFGERKNPLARITLVRSKEFAVESILELDIQDVFCLVVPETGNFTLANGLLTGNCSFMAMSDPAAFSELLYILMHGVGAGFSVESKFVIQLPTLKHGYENAEDAIVVEDSKEGWAQAYKELIDYLYDGQIPAIDITKVRPAGARLKTFGGRASGPQPLIDLFDFTIEKFKGAAGRRFTPLEVHDICCKIGDVVVVGGVRRSALISLSDLDSYEMAKAKAGAWWEKEGQRRLSNNSAVYEKKPSIGEFLQEWGHLYESKSGERGIYNRQLAQSEKYAPRRDGSKVVGVNPCAEINLRDMGLCNLSEIIVEPDDDLESLLDKVEIATIIGTVQSTFTNFNFLRPEWQENAEEERLLGVSLTGQFGNELLSGKLGKRALKHTLTEMRQHAISINKKYAKKLGINQSAAITTVKPSGTVSQLTYSSAGMHPWHSEYYLRTVRADIKDPLNQYLSDMGVPSEPDLMNPNSSTVFTFPVKAPEGAITRNDVSAVEHLDIWLQYKRYWTEHNPSITVSVKEDEWIEVANWVYENWDDVGGLSFLPFDEHTYKQAPYQECDETTYKQFYHDTPKTIDWSLLATYEFEDNTVGSQTLSCVSGSCELVDLSA